MEDPSQRAITLVVNDDDEARLDRLCEDLGKSRTDIFSKALRVLELQLMD